MNTKNTIHEQISALADGEVEEGRIESAFAALRTQEGRDAWQDYHQIGDVLRSDDMAFSMSSDFAAKLMRRLDDEPAIVAAPRRQQAGRTHVPVSEASARFGMRRFVFPGVAAAIMATLTILVAQQWIGTGKDMSSSMVAASGQSSMNATTGASAGGMASVQQERNLMRDPGIDEYLLAHQRFSPSLYSTAQYARSATFAVDSDK